jgi:hypothetical protein
LSFAAYNVKQHCEDKIERAWVEDPVFNEIAVDIISVINYIRLAGLYRQHGGGNNYTGKA